MFGSSPCCPGFKDNPDYVNIHFYCSCCKGVVQPKEVSVLVVGSDGKASGIAPILRCQSHLIDGMCCSGPITTLSGLYPKDEEAVRIREKMKSVYFRVRNLDLCALLHFIGAGVLCFSGVILGVIVASPVIPVHQWFFPAILLGVGFVLCLIGAIFSYFSKTRVREWLDLSQHYVQHCEPVHVQAGTEKYVVLTEFPPSCHLLDPILASPPLDPTVLPLPISELIPAESASSFS
ncbi:hypothetical protein NVRI1_00830 [Chlamydia abortus]|uniref:hypothetical protein n=1 Tax=Chlamydia abortus TaxID=83555 RepID=UPI00192AD8DF|nr:hypothetical protein [Chlamydia abortus]CAD7583468.1 Inclusion membrane protein-38 [Chlamydia abortus]CAG9046468.1 hypothetical protein NVRI1_00830 [Chlamydia abortus]